MKKNLQEREYASVPTEGKWFEVNPIAIDQKLFKQARKNPKQEEVRLVILEAFEEITKNLKYARPFKTIIPPKTWNSRSERELRFLACELGDHIANWVEQALEWAQRISNGESWEDICNKRDTANWYRLVVWKDDKYRLIGGAKTLNEYTWYAPTNVYKDNTKRGYACYQSVPLVVDYDD